MSIPLEESPSPEPTAPASPWAPLKQPVFRMLWLSWLTANVCMWMNDVAAAWMMTSLAPNPVWVALVQTASTLPVFLLGLPSGALADLVNRRHYFMLTQVWVAANALVLALTAFTGALNPPLLLLLVFVNGVGLAMRWPVFAAIVPDLVERRELPQALALNGIAMNSARIGGPIVAGALIAAFGGAAVFALNAVLSVFAAMLIYRWRHTPRVATLPGERFVGAMRVGLQYVRQSPHMRVVLTRISVFFLHSTALVALLPLEAKRLGGEAGTFTLLLACMGAGAIALTAMMPRLRQRWSTDQVIQAGIVVQALMTAGVAVAPNTWLAALAMFVNGAAWIAAANTLNVAAQLALPDWVRARGMSIYQMCLMAGAAAGAALWGYIASHSSVGAALLAASASALVSALVMRRQIVNVPADDDLTPQRVWPEPQPRIPLRGDDGPVMVTIEYRVDEADVEAFSAVMQESRRSRLQLGALSWGLFRDAADPQRWVEYFVDESWVEHLRRFDRVTAADVKLRAQRAAFHRGEQPPLVRRYVAQSLRN